MAFIAYGLDTVLGKQVAEALADVKSGVDKLNRLAAIVNQIGPSGLEANSCITVATGQGQAFNDTFLQIVDTLNTAMGDGSGGTLSEKIARLERGD